MPEPAARISDNHTCPLSSPAPHVGGPITTGAAKLKIEGQLSARVTDGATCVGPIDTIATGSMSVIVEDLCAARKTDKTLHGGTIVTGAATVKIGQANNLLDTMAGLINPTNSTRNCGFNIDAVIDRLYGTNPNATTLDQLDGTFTQIEARHRATFTWGNTLDSAASQVRSGGHGTTALVGITYASGGAHVVPMTNWYGMPVIVEGQTWGATMPAEAIYDGAVAQARYNPANVGVAVLPTRAP